MSYDVKVYILNFIKTATIKIDLIGYLKKGNVGCVSKTIQIEINS